LARSVVLMSGGLASAVVAALAADEGEAIWLHLDYGQRNAPSEAAAVERLAEHFKPSSVLTVPMRHWDKLGDFPILSLRDRLPDAMTVRKGPDVAYLPGLLPAMLGTALALASRVQADSVFIGLIEDRAVSDIPTYELYPDRSRECVAAMNWLFQVCSQGLSRTVRLEAPLIASKQADVVLLGHRLGVPFDRTWSCYRAEPAPCRRCYGCVARASGFAAAGLIDPLVAPAGA